MRWLAVMVLAALIVGLTWWKVSSRHAELPPVPSGVLATQPSAEAWQGQVRSQRVGTSSDLSPQEAGTTSQAHHDAMRAQSAEVVNAGHNKLLSQYQNEKVDAHWARVRERSLVSNSVSQQIQDLKVEPKNMTVHCRSTTCAIAADFATQGAADDWLTLYATSPGTNLFNLSSQVTANADGTAHIQIYGLAKN